MQARARRSVLYMPGSNSRALEKGRTLAADALILDLEDAVAPDAKDAARGLVTAAVKAGGYGRRERVIRINGMDTPWGESDLRAAIDARPDAILIPKVSRADDVMRVAASLNEADAPASVRLWAMMETPLAMLNAAEIASAAGAPAARFDCLIMGTNDLAKETRASLGSGRIAMLGWLSTCVAAARAHGLDIIDGVFNNFRDDDGFREECSQGVTLGMDGKTLIHPGQIAPCNELFSPTDEEIDRARQIIVAFALPENQGKGVIQVSGRMVELLHLDMAHRTVAIAEAIADAGGAA